MKIKVITGTNEAHFFDVPEYFTIKKKKLYNTNTNRYEAVEGDVFYNSPYHEIINGFTNYQNVITNYGQHVLSAEEAKNVKYLHLSQVEIVNDDNFVIDDNKDIETHDFGWAISKLKEGKLVARLGWNEKNMFLWLKPAGLINSEWCKDERLKKIAEDAGGTVEALGTICMKTADNKILSGWLASQTDMLSEDWIEINF